MRVILVGKDGKEIDVLIIHKRAWGDKGKVYVSFRYDKSRFKSIIHLSFETDQPI